jgi:predicted ester cyclase
MSATTHKQIVSQYFEQVWNERDLSLIDRLMNPDVRARRSGQPALKGMAMVALAVEMALRQYEDLHFTVCELLAEGDMVAARWKRSTTYAEIPEDRQVTISGMSFFRLEDDRITDIWISADDLGELQQLHLIPA